MIWAYVPVVDVCELIIEGVLSCSSKLIGLKSSIILKQQDKTVTIVSNFLIFEVYSKKT